MHRSEQRRKLLNEAWIGDAVLALYARLKILRETGEQDAAKFARMTSNQFLNGFAEPAVTEAELGRIFERDGLDAAFAWIEQTLMPLFERQEENRRKRSSAGTPRAR